MAKEVRISEIWTSRVQSAQDAIRRSRYAFLTSVVISVAVIVAEYNSQFSWYVNFALNQHFSPDSTVTTLAQQEMIKSWVNSNRVTVSLLGINLAMSDAAFLASTGLYIMSIWFYYNARRENHLIGSLLIDACHIDDENLKGFVYHGIASHLVFVTITDDDHPIDSLEIGHLSRFKPSLSVRPAFRFLLFLPVVAIAIIVFTDIWSIFSAPLARYPHSGILFDVIVQYPRQLLQLIFMEVYALMIGVAAYYSCRDISRFQSATGSVLLDFAKQHTKELELRNQL